ALGLASARVFDCVARLERARVDTNETQLAVWVVDQLETQRRKRLTIICLADEDLRRIVGIDTLDRRHIERTWQVVNDRVKQGLNALVLKGRTTQHREDLHSDRRLTQRDLQFLGRRNLTLEELVQHVIVVLRYRLDQLHAEGFCL